MRVDSREDVNAGGLSEWVHRPNTVVAQLGRKACCALHREDQALFKAMSRTARARYQKEPMGLTYWLYETTLVYLVFKAWSEHHYVKWDWEPAAGKKARGAPKHIDLVVTAGKNQIAFEAKWWNSHAAGVSMKHDTKKLRHWATTRGGPDTTIALLAFWWSTKDRFAADFGDAEDWLTDRSGNSLEYRGSFPTAGPNGEERRFFIDIITVS